MNTLILALVLATALSLLLTPFVIFFAKKIGAIDLPNHRKIHTKIIPRLGGLAIYTSFVISILCFFDFYSPHIKGILLGSAIIVFCGVLDDIYNLKYSTKLVFQTIASFVLIHYGVIISNVSLFTGEKNLTISLGILSLPITLLWILGVTNALNLIDGLDGLACGLATISSLFLCLIFVLTGNMSMSIITIVLCGACLGFIPYNFNPAKIFMGDSGSLFLGFILAAVSIQGTVKYATTIILFAPIMIIGLPIYDTITTIIRRFIQGKSITSPDKQHFHHRMLSFGFSQKQVAIIAYSINIILGLVCTALLVFDNLNIYYIVFFAILIIGFIILENYFFTIKQNKEKQT